MTAVTVLGASGFVGRAVCAELAARGIEALAPGRDEVLDGRHLGHVIYAIGLTADFRSRPFDTVEAHVGKLAQVLKKTRHDSFVYLSSTRVYKGLDGLAHEDARLLMRPGDPDDLYNLSKAMGESLTLSSSPRGRVARLSNVVGASDRSENFLTSVIGDAVRSKRVVLSTALDSEKDYVRVGDVARLLVDIALSGREQIYNVASGVNVTHRELLERVRQETGCSVEVKPGAPSVRFAPIDTRRARGEFGYEPTSILADVSDIVRHLARHGENT